MKIAYVLAVGLLIAGASEAQTKKADKKKAATAATSSTPAKDAKKAEETRKGPARFKDAPKLEDAEKEAIADAKRDEAIDSLKKIIPKIEDGSPQKADLLFQLSELYWEKSKYLYRREMGRFQEDEKKADEAKNRGEKVADAKEDHRESELYRSETMRLYELILKEYPAYERKDEVLFSLGYNLYELGKRDQAVRRYEELIRSYPGSKFVGDTYVQLGNHYFDIAANLAKAKEMYEKAFANPNPKIRSYALYKLAWCDFNAGEHDAALRKLQKVVEDAKGVKEMADLKNEALNDTVQMFVQLNKADDAMAYFKANAGKKKQITLTRKLAYQLAEAGHNENAIKTFRFILDDNPNAEEAPDLQQAIVKSFESLRQRDQVKAEIKKLAELYRPGAAWWKANESKAAVLRNGFNVAEEAMRTLVTDYHQEAQKTKNVETYRLARDIYKQYVDAFASGDNEDFISDFAFNLRFFYAEILWALEEWEPAARAYDTVVVFKIPKRESAKEASNEKYRQSAAYNALLSYEKLVKIDRGQLQKSEIKEGQKIDETKKKGVVEKQAKIQKRSAKDLEEQPLTKNEEALVAACDRYNQLYPNNQDEIDVRYQAAVIHYDRNHFVEAARRFGEIILKLPEEKRSQEAADLSMAVLEEKQEWFELNKLSKQFQANKRLNKAGSEFAKRVNGVVEGSQYKYVDEVIYKKEKNVKKAAEEFLKFVQEFPRSDNADRALTYALVIFQEASELDRAIDTGERLLKEYPGSAFELKARFSLGKLYEKIAAFEKSAEAYEAFIATYDEWAGPKAVGFENLKDVLRKEKEKELKEKAAKKDAKKDTKPADTKAAKGKGAVARVEPKKLDAKEKEERVKEAEKENWVPDAQFNAALWWEGLGKSDRAITAYTRYMARFKDKKDVPELAYNLGLIYEKDKKWPEAAKQYASFVEAYAKDNRTTELRRLDARYREFLAFQKLKSTAEMDKVAKEIITAYGKLPPDDRKNDRALAAVAHSRFHLLEPMWKAYTDIKFNKVSSLKDDLKAKLKKIQEVEKAYTDVLAIGSGEYGIAALTRIGMAYADFAQNLLDSPDPKKLDEDQLAMYRGELENRAFPLEEKAIEALEKGLAKSYELAVYNEWTLLAQDKLNKYRPGAYGKAKEVPFRGSEVFVTAAAEKVTTDARPLAPAPVPAAPAAPAPAPAKGAP